MHSLYLRLAVKSGSGQNQITLHICQVLGLLSVKIKLHLPTTLHSYLSEQHWYSEK